jgi:hypothetical protein
MWYVVYGMRYAVCGMRYAVRGMWYVLHHTNPHDFYVKFDKSIVAAYAYAVYMHS